MPPFSHGVGALLVMTGTATGFLGEGSSEQAMGQPTQQQVVLTH